MSVVLYNNIENIIRSQLIKYLTGKSDITENDIEHMLTVINDVIKKNVDQEVEREIIENTNNIKEKAKESKLESKKAKVLAYISEWRVLIREDGTEDTIYKSKLDYIAKIGVALSPSPAPCDINKASDNEFLLYKPYMTHWYKYLDRVLLKSSDNVNEELLPYVAASWKDIFEKLKSSDNIVKTLEHLVEADQKNIISAPIMYCESKALEIIKDIIPKHRYYCCKRKRPIDPQESCFNKKAKL